MLARRFLALYLTLCVAVGFVTTPAGASVRLVCRMTGRPMAPIIRREGAGRSAAAERMPCCVVTARPAPGGGARFALSNRSCCDLRIRAAHGPLPPALPAVAHGAPAAALPAPAALPAWGVAAAAAGTPSPTARTAAPRAPPPASRSPRAPPAFS